MVTVYIEGDNPQNQSLLFVKEERKNLVATSFIESNYRKSFRMLFQQITKSEDNPKIIVDTFGGIKLSAEVKERIKNILDENKKACLLLDLDKEKTEKKEQLENNWNEFDDSRIFFFIQRMESWILSQPQKFIEYYDERFERTKKLPKDIEKYKYYFTENFEDIIIPDEKIKSFLRHYWKEKYSKTQSVPKLIELLSLERLIIDFEDAKKLVDFILT